MANPSTFFGYRRENGRIGVRNYVVILPVDDISNAACEAVANNIKGTMALPHAYGRLQFGEDLDLHFRTMIGTGANPNVAACIVIGIEPGWTQKIVDGIAATGKPVAGFSIEQNGDIETIAMASRKAKEFVHQTSGQQREECDLSEIWVSAKCGESDTTTGLASCPAVGNLYDKLIPTGIYGVFGETSEITGAEHLCAARAATPEVGEKFMKTFQAYQDEVIEPFKTSDLSDSQPTKGNIEGGLTTIEEKAMGNLENRQAGFVYRRARTCGSTRRRARTVLHGYVVGGRGMRDPDGCRRLRCACLSYRPGKYRRQPDHSGRQTDRQPPNRAHDVGAYRRRRVGRNPS